VFEVRAHRGTAALMVAVVLLATVPGEALAKTECPPPVSQSAQDSAPSAAATPASGRSRARTARAGGEAPRIRLILDEAPTAISFARERGMLDVPVVLKTTSPLPRDVEPSDLRLEVLRDLRRVGDGLVSVPRIVPTLSSPLISHVRDRISFNVCVDGDGLKAGTYTGTVTVSGPLLLDQVDVPVAVTVKDWKFFIRGVGLAMLVTLLFLLYKELRNDDKVGYAAWRRRRRPSFSGRLAGLRRRVAYFMSPRSRFGVDFVAIECLVPIGAAFAAMFGIYSATAGWGSDGLAQVFSLFTAAFTAAGVRSLIVTGLPRRDGDGAGEGDTAARAAEDEAQP
jgi:hypothetical protein